MTGPKEAAAGVADRRHWHAVAPEAAIDAMDVDPAHGLRQEEAVRRRAQYGPNMESKQTIGRMATEASGNPKVVRS